MRQHRYTDVSNLNAPYDNMSLQGYGSLGGGALGFNMEEEHNIPWMESSPVTLSIQKSLNQSLTADGYNILLEDGVLGPRTCGALKQYGRLDEVWGACDAHTSEFMAPTKASGSALTQTSEQKQTSLQRSGSGVPSWVWAILFGGLAVGGALYMKKRRGRRGA